jgi:uncharacterized secreted protein with C-terminal beta-propeller domain
MKAATSRTALFALLVIAGTILIGCQTRPDMPTTTGTYTPTSAFDPEQNINARQFQSEQELRTFLSSNQGGGNGGYGLYARGAVMEDAVLTKSMAVTGAGAPAATPQAASFSTTNNQVAGIDEADTTKTDGQYIYTITGNTVFIVKAGEDAKVVKKIELKNAPSGMFIDGDRLAVFGNFYDLDYFKSIDYVPRNGMTYLTIYDITDRENPTVVKEYKFEGNYFDGRMHDGNAYLVITSSAENREHPTPIIMEGSAKRQMPAADVYYYPIPYDNVQFATVHAVNLRQPADVQSKAVAVQYGNNIYMSAKNLYILSTENINEWQVNQDVKMELLEPQLTQKDRELIQKIKDTDDSVLSQSEKRMKIAQVYETYAQYMNESESEALQDKVDNETAARLAKYEALTYTVINRISTENGAVNVAATGKVPGSIVNQFALDESNDVLRIATTIQGGRWWGVRPLPVEPQAATANSGTAAIAKDEPAPSIAAKMMPPIWQQRSNSINNVYALDMSMDVIGNLSGLAEGEQIYSTRFIGDRLYMVTFRQVDPFFVIDLSDPRSIKELGKLKIPGFSRYLHPYDDHTIIGIGRDASDTGRQKGLKISLFDVTDVANPKEVAKFTADDNAYSNAEWEHKAFLFDKEKQLLVIPAYSYNYDYKTGASSQSYNGALVFKVTPSEITMRGIIDHSQGQQMWGPSVERSLWIDDLLYTKSPSLLRVNRISDLYGVQNVTLSAGTTGPYPVY